MHNIFKEIEKKFKVFKTTGASDELIAEAERQLNLTFADDYKKYLSEFGALSFGSTELTGLNVGGYINVVNVTMKERQRNQLFPKGSIVLENSGMEGLLILQKQDGEVYEWIGGEKRVSFPNLNAYLGSKISRSVVPKG